MELSVAEPSLSIAAIAFHGWSAVSSGHGTGGREDCRTKHTQVKILVLALACYRLLHCNTAHAVLQAMILAEEGHACCYICQLSDTPGRLLPGKAAALGVPKGPLFGRLKGGQAVQLPNGTQVQPADVSPLTPSRNMSGWAAACLPQALLGRAVSL